MALGKKREEAEDIEVPMSSMIDVVFLLLVYFIVTYQIEKPEAHLAVNLPGAPPPNTEQEPPPPPMELQVHKDNFYFRGRAMSLDKIRRSLTVLAESDPSTTLVIKVRENAPAESLIKLLDRCKAAGLTNLNVVTI
ncbi:MAG: biopolymer transporter ExbD [Lentisphaeria bacterium]